MQDENYCQHIALNRTTDINQIQEFIQCSLCQGIVWHPVNCGNCQKPFCSLCIQKFHKTKSEKSCPTNECETYVEQHSFLTTRRLLDKVKIDCCYKLNGCANVLSYNQLEEHEKNCDYQLKLCDGCEQKKIQKEFDQHRNECQLLSITCEFCSATFRRETQNLHTEIVCIRTQLQQEKARNEEQTNLWRAFFETVQQLTQLNAKNQ